ncbi:hypothetical protein [Flavobacterium sp.]|uniref:hypothetical protein n=1 Tax=Flavobacterium sp. TaxID=239 RepID=UPI003751BF45
MKKIFVLLLFCYNGYGQILTLVANSYIKQEINGTTKRINKVAILVYSTEYCLFHIDNEIDILLNIDYQKTLQHGYIHESLISQDKDYGIIIDKLGKSSEYGDMYQVSLPHNGGSYIVPNCKIYSGNGQVKGTLYVVNWKELEKKAQHDKILIRQKDSISKAYELNRQIEEIDAGQTHQFFFKNYIII